MANRVRKQDIVFMLWCLDDVAAIMMKDTATCDLDDIYCDGKTIARPIKTDQRYIL